MGSIARKSLINNENCYTVFCDMQLIIVKFSYIIKYKINLLKYIYK